MKMNVQSRRRSVPYYLLAGLAGALIATAVHAQEGAFEKFEPRNTKVVVPADLIQGPHFRLAPSFQTVAYQNNFVISSDYGTFVAPSDEAQALGIEIKEGVSKQLPLLD